MDAEKSREFYQERYYRAIREFGINSLTAKICKKKLALLGLNTKQQTASEDKTKLETDEQF